MLKDCPFCQVVADASIVGDHCAKGTYALPQLVRAQAPEVVQVIVLKEHTDRPTPEAMIEATKMSDGNVGAEVRDVIGHWGMKISRPDWVQKPKASTRTGPDGQIYDSLK